MHSLSESRPVGRLTWFLKGILFLALLLLFGRLAELTVIKGEYFRTLAEGNRIRRVTITAPRGRILARGGEVLAGNSEVKTTIDFHPTEGYTKVDPTDSTPPEEVLTEWQRSYPMGDIVGHITGYLGEVSPDEVRKADPACIAKGARTLGSLKGLGGLEAQYGCLLRGFDGEELVEVDIMGNKIRTVGRRPAVAGEDLHTTIDADLQRVIAENMKDIVGAVVATDTNGEVLALVSSPSFSPELFNPLNPNKEQAAKLLTDEKLPLFNRAISGAYHPGSIFKLVTSTAALEEGKITSEFQYEDTGAININEFSYTTWYFTQYGRTEGKINVIRALARSTDTFYYKVGEMLGAEALGRWAAEFGVGKETGIDIPNEMSGLLATPEWKERVIGERWFLGNTYHMSIGQGDMTTTPLQGNVLTSVIASGGSICIPHLQKSGQNCKKLAISPHTIETVKEGMIQACTTGGTAYPFFDFTPQIACKTGTAETNEEDVTHAWFTLFAPVEKPEIVLTVLVEKGGEGSKVAAPIARKIMDYWFRDYPRQ